MGHHAENFVLVWLSADLGLGCKDTGIGSAIRESDSVS
jgi:hypothetical protein